VAESIRTILGAAGMKLRKRVTLEILAWCRLASSQFKHTYDFDELANDQTRSGRPSVASFISWESQVLLLLALSAVACPRLERQPTPPLEKNPALPEKLRQSFGRACMIPSRK
jgi:hypothetical protein